MEFQEVVKKRYACKSFDGTLVDQKQLDIILEAGRLAPTAKNLQEQRIYVVQSQEGLNKIDKVTPCRYGAATVIIVAFDKHHVFTYPGEKRDSGIEDATIVATHMMLAAHSLGIGSCWLNQLPGLTNMPLIRELLSDLDVPVNHIVYGSVVMGYAAEEPKQAALRKNVVNIIR